MLLAGLLAMSCLLCPEPAPAATLGTSFSYQGHLLVGGTDANGSYDFRLTVYNSATNGLAVSEPFATNAVAVTSGRFGLLPDFGSVFNGNALWLDVEVRTNGATAYSALQPREFLSPAAQALFAVQAGSAGYAATAGSASSIPLAALPNIVLTDPAAFDPAGSAAKATNGLAAALMVLPWPGWTNGVLVAGASDPGADGAYYWQGSSYSNSSHYIKFLPPYYWRLCNSAGRVAYRSTTPDITSPWIPSPLGVAPAPVVGYMTGQLAVALAPVLMNGALITNLDANQLLAGQVPLTALTQSLAKALNPIAMTGVGTNAFSVVDYGAKGDGITDDHTAIEAALQAAIQVGGEVVFPARPGRPAIYNDSAGHYIFTNNFPTWPFRPCCLIRGGGPGVVWRATFTRGILANGFFDMEDLLLEGQGSVWGTGPSPTNYCGIYEWGPWGTYCVLRRVGVTGFGYGLICHQANPRCYELHARYNVVGIGLGMQNDTALFHGCEVYYNTVGLETGCFTPPATNALVAVPANASIEGSAEVTANGMWDYNGTDFVLGGIYGSYHLSVYGEAQTNCNLMIGHNPAIWPALAAGEAGRYIRVVLENCSWSVNPPPENIQIFTGTLLGIRSSHLYSPCAVHSYTGAGDQSVIEIDALSNLFGSQTNLLTSTGTAQAGLTGAWFYSAGQILHQWDAYGNLALAGVVAANLAGGSNYPAFKLRGSVQPHQITGQLTNNTTGTAAYAAAAGVATQVFWSALPGVVLTNAAAFDPAGSALAAVTGSTTAPAAFSSLTLTNGLTLSGRTLTLQNPPTGTPSTTATPAAWIAITNNGSRYYLPVYR